MIIVIIIIITINWGGIEGLQQLFPTRGVVVICAPSQFVLLLFTTALRSEDPLTHFRRSEHVLGEKAGRKQNLWEQPNFCHNHSLRRWCDTCDIDWFVQCDYQIISQHLNSLRPHLNFHYVPTVVSFLYANLVLWVLRDKWWRVVPKQDATGNTWKVPARSHTKRCRIFASNKRLLLLQCKTQWCHSSHTRIKVSSGLPPEI